MASPSAPVMHAPPVSTADTALSGANTDGGVSQSSERLAHDSDSHSSGEPPSPVLSRAARSQISTAVSFEGARAAGSAALPSRSLDEESALSAAEGDECSLSREDNVRTIAGPLRALRGDEYRPSNSLISTAVQPSGQRQHNVSSPKQRGNSYVSQTPHQSLGHGILRGGTPGSIYAQDGTPVVRLRPGSPPLSQTGEQLSAAGELQEDSDGWRRMSHLLQNGPVPGPPPVEHQGEASFMPVPSSGHLNPPGFRPGVQHSSVVPGTSLVQKQQCLDQHGDSINCAMTFQQQSNAPAQLWNPQQRVASGPQHEQRSFHGPDHPPPTEHNADASHRNVVTSRNMDNDHAPSRSPFLPMGVHALFNPAMPHVDASNAMQLAQALQQQLQALNALAVPAISYADHSHHNHFPPRPHHPGALQVHPMNHSLPTRPQDSANHNHDNRAALSHHSQQPYASAPAPSAPQPHNPLPILSGTDGNHSSIPATASGIAGNIAGAAGPSIPQHPVAPELAFGGALTNALNPQQLSFSHHMLQQTALSLIAQATSMATQGNNPLGHHPPHRLQGDFPLASVPMPYSQAQSKTSKLTRSDRQQDRYAAPEHAAAPGGGRSGSTLAVSPAVNEHHSAAASQDEGGAGGSECMGPPASLAPVRQVEQPACSTHSPNHDAGHPAASVHATVEADEGLSEGETDLSSMHRGGRQHPMPHMVATNNADIASQRCGASHSASLAPSMSTPAVAMATGPMSASTVAATSGPDPMEEGHMPGNSSLALGLMPGPSNRSVSRSGGATNSGTVNMSARHSSMGMDEGGDDKRPVGLQAGELAQGGSQSERRQQSQAQDCRAMSVQDGSERGRGSQGDGTPALEIQGLQVSEHINGRTFGYENVVDNEMDEAPLLPHASSGTRSMLQHARSHVAASGALAARGAQESTGAAAEGGSTGQREGSRGPGHDHGVPMQDDDDDHHHDDDGQEGPDSPGAAGPLLAANSAAMPAPPRPAVAEVTDLGEQEPDGIGSPVWPATCSASNGDHHLPEGSARGGRAGAVRPTGSVNFAGPGPQEYAPLSGDEADGREAGPDDQAAPAQASQMQVSSSGTAPPERALMLHRPHPAHAAALGRRLGSHLTSVSQPLDRHRHGSYASNLDVVPQETEIHGVFQPHNHAATAAAAQLQRDLSAAAAAAASEVLPQDTEVHGLYGQLAATAAAAQMAAATHTTPTRGLPPLPHHHASWSQARGPHRGGLARPGAAGTPQNEAAGPSRGRASQHPHRSHRTNQPQQASTPALPLFTFPVPDPLSTPPTTNHHPSPSTSPVQPPPEAASALRQHSAQGGYTSSNPSPNDMHVDASPADPNPEPHIANGPAHAEFTAAADSDGPSHGQPAHNSNASPPQHPFDPPADATVSEHANCTGVCSDCGMQARDDAQRSNATLPNGTHSLCNGSVSNNHTQHSPTSSCRNKSNSGMSGGSSGGGGDQRSTHSHNPGGQQQQPQHAAASHSNHSLKSQQQSQQQSLQANLRSPTNNHNHHHRGGNSSHNGAQSHRPKGVASSGRSQGSNHCNHSNHSNHRNGLAGPSGQNHWQNGHLPVGAAAAGHEGRGPPQPQMTEVGHFHLDPSAASISDGAGGDFGQDAAVNQQALFPAENGEELEGPAAAHAEAQRSAGDHGAGPSGQRVGSKSAVSSPGGGTSSSNGRRGRRDYKRQRMTYEGYQAADCSMSTS